MNYKPTPDKFQAIKITQITMSRKVNLSQRAVIHFEKNQCIYQVLQHIR